MGRFAVATALHFCVLNYTKTACGLAMLLVLLLVFVLVISAVIRELRVLSLIPHNYIGWRCDSRLLALLPPMAACLPNIHHSPG